MESIRPSGKIRKAQRALAPAVVHVGGSGRLQIVYRQTNPRYWSLIEAFRESTDVPTLPNTPVDLPKLLIASCLPSWTYWEIDSREFLREDAIDSQSAVSVT